MFYNRPDPISQFAFVILTLLGKSCPRLSLNQKSCSHDNMKLYNLVIFNLINFNPMRNIMERIILIIFFTLQLIRSIFRCKATLQITKDVWLSIKVKKLARSFMANWNHAHFATTYRNSLVDITFVEYIDFAV